MIYYINRNAQIKTGEHMIHAFGCKYMPKKENCILLGQFYNSRVARSEAKKYFSCINGCKYCCFKIHLKR